MQNSTAWLSQPFTPTAPTGLTSGQAQVRLAQYGPNTFRTDAGKALVLQFLARFKNPLVLILLAASAVSAFSGELTNFILISSMVLMSVTLDFVQEYRANAAAEKLRDSVALRARVWRDNQAKEIPVTDVVPGDLVLLQAGDLVCADGRIIEARDFFVNQALLTGEPYPVEKHAMLEQTQRTDLQEASHAAFMGTSVISGVARLQVVHTGTLTALGQIADRISRPATLTSFELGSRRFGMMILRLTLLMVMFVLFANAAFGKPWMESFLFAVALAVGLTPELLPMVISVTLARGAMRMAKQDMIVKRLTAIQELGSMDVLCTDKTGTLTEARIGLAKSIDPMGQTSDAALRFAYLNSYFESGLKNPLDEAILTRPGIDTAGWKKIDEVPFDFERRCVSVLLEHPMGNRLLIAKGAPDQMLQLCTRYTDNGISYPIDGAAHNAICQQYHALESEGYRVLGVAWRDAPSDLTHAAVDDERELILAGFVAFLDPPKMSAAPVFAALQRSGVQIKIVTGDSALVTTHVCRELQLHVENTLTGEEIQALDDRALQARVQSTTLFCRVNPAQKERVIVALRACGHVVGYLGDGINDGVSFAINALDFCCLLF